MSQTEGTRRERVILSLLRESRGLSADPGIMSRKMLALPVLGFLLSATLCEPRTVGLARPPFGALKLNSAGQLRNNVRMAEYPPD